MDSPGMNLQLLLCWLTLDHRWVGSSFASFCLHWQVLKALWFEMRDFILGIRSCWSFGNFKTKESFPWVILHMTLFILLVMKNWPQVSAAPSLCTVPGVEKAIHLTYSQPSYISKGRCFILPHFTLLPGLLPAPMQDKHAYTHGTICGALFYWVDIRGINFIKILCQLEDETLHHP